MCVCVCVYVCCTVKHLIANKKRKFHIASWEIILVISLSDEDNVFNALHLYFIAMSAPHGEAQSKSAHCVLRHIKAIYLYNTILYKQFLCTFLLELHTGYI